MDAEVISIQLQGLLNIPPIKKPTIPAQQPDPITTSIQETRRNYEELSVTGFPKSGNVQNSQPPTLFAKKQNGNLINLPDAKPGEAPLTYLTSSFQETRRNVEELPSVSRFQRTRDADGTQPSNVGRVAELRNGQVDDWMIRERHEEAKSDNFVEIKTADEMRAKGFVMDTARPAPQPLCQNSLGLGQLNINNLVLPCMPTLQNHEQVQQQMYNERTPPYQIRAPAETSVDGRRGFVVTNESMRSRSKIISQMNELLRIHRSSKNIMSMRDKLIVAALEEHRPNYYLHLDKEVLELFLIRGVEPLTKRSTKFVRAKYFCRLCNYHMDNVTNVLSHVSNQRHVSNEQVMHLERHVESIPFPTVNHETNLHLFIAEVTKSYAIDESERNLRYGVLAKLNAQLAPHKFQLELFGSSVPGFGFKTSDINLNLDLSKARSEETDEPLTNTEHAIQFAKLSRLLETFSFVRGVGEGRYSLQITFTDVEVNRYCSIQVNNTSGMILSQLFQEYDKLDSRVKPLVVAFRKWAQVTEIDDQEKGFLPGHVYTIMVLKHLLDVRVIPYIINPDNSVNFRSFYKPKDASEKWISPNKQNLGGLWLGLLRKYSIEFPVKEQVVSLVQANLLKSEDKAWCRKLSVEDPILPRSDLCRAASTSRVFDYVLERIKLAFKYFGLPRMIGRRHAFFERIIPFGLVRQPHRIYFYSKPRPPATVAGIGTESVESPCQRQPESEQSKKGPKPHMEELRDIPRIRLIDLCDYNGDPEIYAIAEDLVLMDKIFTPGDFYYEFARDICQGGEEPPIHCKSCGQDGHTRRHCPDELVPTLSLVSNPDSLTFQALDKVMLDVYAEKSLPDVSTPERKLLLDDIFRSLVNHFPDIELILFGSTVNGFGLRGSDVDVSVRFKNHPFRKADFHSEEVTNVLKGIVERLRTSGCMQEILAIPSAKVPIVKFIHKRTHLEGDLSLSNELALRNTNLLRSYAMIDPRVQVLGCFLKQLTKLCDISDASKGSLSSYAYVLMLIHFLQQHSTPVLPVLQQIPAENRPEHPADGWDTYFFETIEPSILSRHWKYLRSNTDSVGQLLWAFIKYYTEIFNFEEHVVTISQLEPLSRKEKCWTSATLICIEDPFEKFHNLGAGLTRRMGVFIVKTFQRYREVFSGSIRDFSPDISYAGRFLDPARIRGNSNPPTDRQCRICNKIGHFANTCNYGSGTMSEEPSSEGRVVESMTQQDLRNQVHVGSDSPTHSPPENGFDEISPTLDLRMQPKFGVQENERRITAKSEPRDLGSVSERRVPEKNRGSEKSILGNGPQSDFQDHAHPRRSIIDYTEEYFQF